MEETLGKRIAANRKKLGLTQDALAEQLGVTAQAVSKWENNQSYPDITMLPKLAEIFDVTTDELLGVPKKKVHLAELLPEEPELSEQESVPSEEPETPKPFREDASKHRGITIALWLLLSGIAAFLNSLHQGYMSIFDCLIASGILIFGLNGLLFRFSLFRFVCIVAGCFFLLQISMSSTVAGIDWNVVFAIGLALLGLNLLVDTLLGRKKEIPAGHKFDGSFKNYCTYDGSHFDCATCFGHGDRLVQLPLLSGGRGEVTFGELHIDLNGCPEIADGCSIDLRCSFGSLEILVPRNFRVEITSQSAFGSVEEKGAANPAAEKNIYITCRASFGQIILRHI